MKKVFLILTPAIIAISILVSCDQKNEQSNKDSEKRTAEIFSLETVDTGKKISLDDFKGKPVILNFWATWCGPCKEELPVFQKMWNKYKDKDVAFIGIDVMDDRSNAAEFIKNNDITYTILYDQQGEISSKYKVVALPATFFINKEGKIAVKNYGPFIGEEGEKKFKLYVEEITE
ncbi:MAG: TlpA disulfide reductase family protein [Thermodesulfobacteriota bacterium]